MEIKIRTLTPIWTGNVERRCEKLRETSLIGSLRWWFEVIVRGFDCYACDSVGDVKCELDYKSFKSGVDPKDLICPVCYVFGTTGWSRRFKLKIKDDNLFEIKHTFIVKAKENNKHKGWFLGKETSGGVLGEFTVEIYKTYNKYENIIPFILHLSSLWGIGAKIQDGFGICKFEKGNDLSNILSLIEELTVNRTKDDNNSTLPSLDNFFFAKIKIFDDVEEMIKNSLNNKLYIKEKNKKTNTIKDRPINVEEFLNFIPEKYRGQFYPTAPLIRYWLRGLFRNGNDDLRHFLFGFVATKSVHNLCGGEVIKKGNAFICKKCKKKVEKGDVVKVPSLIFNNKKYEKMASKIFVSHIYKLNNNQWEFKIWGYIPKILPNNEDREKVLQKLFSEIKENKNFASILSLDKDSIEVEWYEYSQERSDVSSVKELIERLVEVGKDD